MDTRIVIKVSSQLKAQAKSQAALAGKTLTQYIIDLLTRAAKQ